MKTQASKTLKLALALAGVLVPGVMATPSAHAQTYRVLHSFNGGTDGSGPYGGLIRDAAGNFYGTTSGNAPNSSGTVFTLDRTTGKETALYVFTGGTDGNFPQAGLLMDAAGNLYGTTVFGGAYGNGNVFKLDASGTETVLYSFTGGTDGAEPICSLVRDAAGNLYGTTAGGGASNAGTVFKVDTTGKETVLYSFTGGTDGGYPQAGVIRDEEGNFYGTALVGAYSAGVVFKLDTARTETVLYDFTGGTDGGYPYAALIRDAAGNLYGTTNGGGASNQGTVFKVGPPRKETVLYSFTGGADGANPAAGLVRDAAGDLYGTTEYGGDSNAGTVFKVDTTGTETVLHTFTGGKDGANPYAGLLRAAAGSLYGTALYGGASNDGVVFGLKP